MLPHGGDIGLKEDVAGIGLEDDVAAQAAAEAVRALAVDAEVGSGRARFRGNGLVGGPAGLGLFFM